VWHRCRAFVEQSRRRLHMESRQRAEAPFHIQFSPFWAPCNRIGPRKRTPKEQIVFLFILSGQGQLHAYEYQSEDRRASTV